MQIKNRCPWRQMCSLLGQVASRFPCPHHLAGHLHWGMRENRISWSSAPPMPPSFRGSSQTSPKMPSPERKGRLSRKRLIKLKILKLQTVKVAKVRRKKLNSGLEAYSPAPEKELFLPSHNQQGTWSERETAHQCSESCVNPQIGAGPLEGSESFIAKE